MADDTQNTPPISPKRVRNTSGLRPWPKGVSGNPGGRPKGVREAAKEQFEKLGGLQAWVDLYRNAKSESTKVEALKMLSFYTLGKPVDTILTGELSEEQTRAAQGLPTDRLEALAQMALEAQDPKGPTES